MRLMKMFFVLILFVNQLSAQEQGMDKTWGEQTQKLERLSKGKFFYDGNYAMFIHWGLFSHLANKWNGKTYYGIGEWLMSKDMAKIPVNEYMKAAAEFNPTNFNAGEIAKLAKAAGMKYIIINSKHHDGFAMYHSKANKFNIIDATPFTRDPMKELAEACKEEGIGLGFYYSHSQDWTSPGGRKGPEKLANGEPATFADYFYDKCLPQVKEITSNYGDLAIVWFDTPGNIEKKYVEQLVKVVRENQPQALMCSRVGYDFGDYKSIGDMEVPLENIDGYWESPDVTNDSWGYAWYDNNWKAPKQILSNVISTVARGGTYLLNIGPKGDGSVPEQAAYSLKKSGDWIKRYPQVVYSADPSPWKHALPWGDVTVRNNTLYLAVYEWPLDGKLYLPGLQTEISSTKLLKGNESVPISSSKENGWICFNLPYERPEKLVSVIVVNLEDKPEVKNIHGVDPAISTIIAGNFANTEKCVKEKIGWMEKFGEWKHVVQISKWEESSKVSWEVDVLKPGNYQVDLNYSGNGKIVWAIETEEGIKIQNQQSSSSIYAFHPIGWLKFEKAGKHIVSVSLVEGERSEASLASIRFSPIEY